jgi:hypothetical protein
VRRYIGDSYFCQDYDQWFPPRVRASDFGDRLDLRNAFLSPGCEAQWCLFDPLLSVIYGRRFLASGAMPDFHLQLQFFNSVGQITWR